MVHVLTKQSPAVPTLNVEQTAFREILSAKEAMCLQINSLTTATTQELPIASVLTHSFRN
jgi:hypothetical protein